MGGALVGKQLVLDITPHARYQLSDFIVSQSSHAAADNATVVNVLGAMLQGVGEQQLFLYASEGCGKTHLLQAACASVQHYQPSSSSSSKDNLSRSSNNINKAAYCPLKQWVDYDVSVLDNLEQYDLIALDDVHVCAGRADWETALFNLINRCRAQQRYLLFSANNAPDALGVSLPDLQSRFLWGTVMAIDELNDEQKHQWLDAQARRLGFVLSEEVCQYIIRHSTRSMHTLLETLNRLNDVSLEQKKRITVPVLKTVLMNQN